jgi:hypothetical protein
MARLVHQPPEGEPFGHGHNCNDGTRQRVTMRPSSVDPRLPVVDARIRTADQADRALSRRPPDQRGQNSRQAVSRLAYGQVAYRMEVIDLAPVDRFQLADDYLKPLLAIA